MKYYTMNIYGGVEVQLHALTLALNGGEWSVSRPSHFTLGERFPNPLHKRLSGPQSQSGHDGYDRNSLPVLGIEH
jgi:hypothetical protein